MLLCVLRENFVIATTRHLLKIGLHPCCFFSTNEFIKESNAIEWAFD